MLKWGRHRHETKSYRWIMNRYFGRFHPARQDRWLFGDRDTGACLTRLSWTPIRRHQMVKADASPDDPTLAYYWRQRRRRRLPPDTPTAPAPSPSDTHRDLLEPDAEKSARPFLRWPRLGNYPGRPAGSAPRATPEQTATAARGGGRAHLVAAFASASGVTLGQVACSPEAGKG